MTGWTAADGAELDVLVHELGRCHADHRERCEACKDRRCNKHDRKVCVTCKAGCPDVLAYLEHREGCRACLQGIKVWTAYYGKPCPRYLQHLAHGKTCKRCNPCPALKKAIAVVIAWREARSLRSRAEALRIDQTISLIRSEAA